MEVLNEYNLDSMCVIHVVYCLTCNHVLFLIVLNSRNTSQNKDKRPGDNVDTENPIYNVHVLAPPPTEVEHRDKVDRLRVGNTTQGQNHREPSDQYCRIASAYVASGRHPKGTSDRQDISTVGSETPHHVYRVSSDEYCRIASALVRSSGNDQLYSKAVEEGHNPADKSDVNGYSSAKQLTVANNAPPITPRATSDETGYSKAVNRDSYVMTDLSSTYDTKQSVHVDEEKGNDNNDNPYNRTTDRQREIPTNEYSRLKGVDKNRQCVPSTYNLTTNGVTFTQPERTPSTYDAEYDTAISRN